MVMKLFKYAHNLNLKKDQIGSKTLLRIGSDLDFARRSRNLERDFARKLNSLMQNHNENATEEGW
jgi:hypothetical protein